MPLIRKIAVRGQQRVTSALRGWAAGFPLDELAFLNRFTASLALHPTCIIHPAVITTHFLPLHRKGHLGRPHVDRYGSDLAVTVRLTSGIGRVVTRSKTAFFQLKRRSLSKSTRIERVQYNDAKSIPYVWKRLFVAGLDSGSPAVEIAFGPDFDGQLHPTKNVTVVHYKPGDWSASFNWLDTWLRCGKSRPDSTTDRVEDLMRDYVDPLPLDWDVEESAAIEPQVLPARIWLIANAVAHDIEF
jgi:hypothetical protein